MPLSHSRVLLVEDNAADARLLREALLEARKARIELVHVARLQIALDRLNAEQFDLILLDLTLPDAEGLATVRRVHAQAPATPIVVLTGLDDEALATQALREGAQDYLVKGQVDGNLLVRAMRYATERQRAVETIQRREEYFRALIENARDLILLVRPDGNLLYASPSLERLLGHQPHAVIDTDLLALAHPEDRASLQDALLHPLAASRASQHLEWRLLHGDGSWRVMEAVCNPLLDHPAVRGTVINARDITPRKEAERAMAELNETLRAVADTSPLPVFLLQIEGTVGSWSRAAEKVFGYMAPEVLGKPLPIIAPEEECAFEQQLAEARQGSSLSAHETRYQCKDGTLVDVSVWTAPLRDASGAVTRLVFAVADNTERKRLEDQVRHAQKMEAVGRLAGGIAHDFNNLLTVITGYCQMLLPQLVEEDPIYGDIEQVLRAAQRAAALTKQLLAFSRRQIVQPKVVDLNVLIADMDVMLRRLVGEDIQVLIEAAPELGHVRADPGQLEQVIVNLVVNARDAMPQGGRVTIETGNVYLDENYISRHVDVESGPAVMLAISDTGTGLLPEARDHLFEPFYTTKERGKGTGLGLSTSYGIVRQNSGHIWVYSELGHGTTFKIYLPRIDEPAEPLSAPELGVGVRNGHERVLLVEDEDGVRSVLSEMLQRRGYQVSIANGFDQAIELFEQTGDFDLLLTDVVMPGRSGRELADYLRSRKPELRVLFVSGYTDAAIVNHGILEPGTAFLQKPFTPEGIALKVREVLDRNPA